MVALVANELTKHPEHVASVAGEKWYKQPIGSLIVAKPHPHALAGEGHHMVSVWGHEWSIPDKAEVYVGKTALGAGQDADSPKLVQLGPLESAKWVLLGKEGTKEIGAQVALDSIKHLSWVAYHTGPPKPSTAHVLAVGGPAGPDGKPAIEVNAAQLASAIGILNAAKSTNVKPPLAKAGHPLADMDYVKIAEDEVALHPELAVPSGTKAQHVGKVKLAVLHHLGAKLEKIQANDAEQAAGEIAKETAVDQAQVAQKLTPSVLDFHGLAVTQAEMQAAADAVDATGSHGSLSAALKKADSPLAKLDHYEVAKTWKKDHPGDKGLSTKAAYTAAIKAALADLTDADQVTGHEDAAKLHEAVQSAPGPEESPVGFATANAALASAMLEAKHSGNAQYVSLKPDYKGEWTTSEYPPVSGGFYTATTYGTAKLSDSVTAPSTTLDYATLHAMVGPYLKGTPLELEKPEPVEPEIPTPQQQAAAASLKESLEAAKAQASKSAQEIADDKAQVAEHLVPDPAKISGTQPISASVQELLGAGEPVAVKPHETGLIAALPGGDKIPAALDWIKAYAYTNTYVKPSQVNLGTWIQGSNAPTTNQKKFGYWELIKHGPDLTITYYPPKKPLEPGSPEAAMYELMLHGAVLPPDQDQKKDFFHVMARAMSLSAKGANNGVYYVRKQYFDEPNGPWTWEQSAPTGERWKVEDGVNVTHVLKDGTEENVPLNTLTGPGGVDSFVTPDSFTIQTGHYPSVFEARPYGHYYKPGGGAHVEVYKTLIGQAYKYHYANGSEKGLNGSQASKYLTGDFTEHFAEPKPGPKPKAKAAATGDLKYATAAGPGSWKLFTTGDPGEIPVGAELHPDGSLLVHDVGADKTEPPVVGNALVHAGWVTDHYGNSLLTPSEKLIAPHVFGKSYTAPELTQILEKIQNSNLGVGTDLEDNLGFKITSDYGDTTPEGKNLISFLESKGAGTYHEEKAAILALLTEMIAAPNGFSAGSTASAEPVFLKSLPPGIHEAKDIFDFGTTGYALPWGQGLLPMTEWGTNAQMKDQIKKVSEQYGSGKVVGTHISSMGSQNLQDWIKAWKSGDMAKVFELDAAGGKVSPVHPGAPKNAGTHKVVWAPYGEGQLPAGQIPEGHWSDTSVTMPHAEVDNYLVKAGLQHAEFLNWGQKREWVNAHRAGSWYTVNKLTQQADESWLAHDTPKTPTPEWTENIVPSKVYTAHLEDKVAAGDWPVVALHEFVTDHGDDPDVKAVAEDYSSAQGFGSGSETWKTAYACKKDVVQKYLDELAAKEAAELAKPKYILTTAPGEVPASAKDQYGHEFSFRPGALDQFHMEPAVSALASAWGFKLPKSQPATLEDGSTGLITDRPDVIGVLAGKSIAGLTPKQAADVAREHVLDWVLASPFGHTGNLLLTPDGGVVGSAKPGLGSLDWDGLAGTKAADEHAKLAITQVFDAIRTHQMPQAVADEAAKAAIKAARRMSQMQDYRLAGYLIGARGETPETASEATKELVGALVTRKASLGEDIEDLWHRVYEDAGWKLPEIPKEALPFGLHSGFSEPSYFDHVIASKVFGAPAFFGGTDLEDGHFQTWTELSGQNRLIRGEGRARGDSLAALTKWCQDNQTHGPTSAGSAVLSTMTQSVADPNQPKGDATYYGKIIAAARAVSRHAGDQMWEGPHTKAALEGMESVKAELTAKLEQADKALDGDQEATKAFISAGNGHPWMASHLAKYYLDQIAKVEDAKATQGTFKPGELPQWTAPKLPDEFKPKAPEPEAAPAPKVLKVERKKAFRELGIPADQVTADSWLLGEDDGELHLTGATYQYPGDAWHIELPTGEVIEFNDSNLTGTPKGPQTGRIRYKADASRGSASLEDVRAQLETMGMPLAEATPDDMELLYWRHLAGVLADRADMFTGKHKAVWDSLHEAMKEHGLLPESGSRPGEQRNVMALAAAKLDPAAEIAAWRKAWATQTTPEQVNDWADNGGFYPHLRHWDVKAPETTGGQPVWYRFDATPEWVNGVKPLHHNFRYGSRDAVLLARTGGGHSTEARLRVLGSYIIGSSSAGDMKDHGSSGGFYLRPPNYAYEGSVMVSPGVLTHTQTYGFNHDAWGDISKRAGESKFDLDGAAGHTRETLAKDGVSLLDDIELMKASSESQRQQIIKELKAAGVTQIRGLPVEDRITTASEWDAAATKVKAHFKNQNYLERGPTYLAPPQEKVTTGLITTEAETTAQAHVAEASADHSKAASKESLNKVYYGSAAGDPLSTDMSKRGKVKSESAARISAAMTSSDEDMLALQQTAGINPPEFWGPNPRIRSAAGFLSTWAANGSNGPLVQALQNRAHDLFGIPKEQLPVINPKPGTEALAKELEDGHQAVIDDFLHAMHSATQADLAEEGIANLTVYRLLKFPAGKAPDWAAASKAGDVIDAAPQRSFSSWGMTPEEIDTDIVWGSGSAVMVKATFPAELALAYPRSGLGCYPQGEFVVLDAPGTWEVVKNAVSA